MKTLIATIVICLVTSAYAEELGKLNDISYSGTCMKTNDPIIGLCTVDGIAASPERERIFEIADTSLVRKIVKVNLKHNEARVIGGEIINLEGVAAPDPLEFDLYDNELTAKIIALARR